MRRCRRSLMPRHLQQFITANKDKPFFLYWAINAPHYPMQGTANWRQRYKDLPSPRRQYAAFTSTVDEKVGELLETLEALDLRKNTLVIFQSDHGHSTEERAFWGGGNAGPYRGAKGCLFEGGIRIPSIVSMPGMIPQGQVRHQMAIGCDWFPTIATYCGAELPDRQYDGKSLTDVIASSESKSPHDHLFWLLGNPKNGQWAVRQGPWKLLGNARDRGVPKNAAAVDKLFLANLEVNPSEEKNLKSQHPEVVVKLQAIRDKHVADIVRENDLRAQAK